MSHRRHPDVCFHHPHRPVVLLLLLAVELLLAWKARARRRLSLRSTRGHHLSPPPPLERTNERTNERSCRAKGVLQTVFVVLSPRNNERKKKTKEEEDQVEVASKEREKK